MRILLDECVPTDLGKSFPDFECWGAHRAGLGGKKNGELLTAAEKSGFDVMITSIRASHISRTWTAGG